MTSSSSSSSDSRMWEEWRAPVVPSFEDLLDSFEDLRYTLLDLAVGQAVDWLDGKHEDDMGFGLDSQVKNELKAILKEGFKTQFFPDSRVKLDQSIIPYWAEEVDPNVTPHHVAGFQASVVVGLPYFTWNIQGTPSFRWGKFAEDVLANNFSFDNAIDSLDAELGLSYNNWEVVLKGEWDIPIGSNSSSSFRLDFGEVRVGYRVTF